MHGKATLDIPASESIGPSRTEGLSDKLAMSYGTLAARLLSELSQEYVVVTLSDGTIKVIGRDSTTGELRIGRLTNNR